jgi:hypothetical protein
VSTTEELLDRKVAAPVEKTENTAVGIRHADHVALSIRKKLAITSPTSGGRLVGIVRSRTHTMEFLSIISSRSALEIAGMSSSGSSQRYKVLQSTLSCAETQMQKLQRNDVNKSVKVQWSAVEGESRCGPRRPFSVFDVGSL